MHFETRWTMVGCNNLWLDSPAPSWKIIYLQRIPQGIGSAIPLCNLERGRLKIYNKINFIHIDDQIFIMRPSKNSNFNQERCTTTCFSMMRYFSGYVSFFPFCLLATMLWAAKNSCTQVVMTGVSKGDRVIEWF